MWLLRIIMEKWDCCSELQNYYAIALEVEMARFVVDNHLHGSLLSVSRAVTGR